MLKLADYMIIQRGPDGYGEVEFEGVWGENGRPDGVTIYARVLREDDNLTVIRWTECECTDEKWSVKLRVPEGGLYRAEAACGIGWKDRVKCVYHFGVGDIYVTCGQSNMTGYARDNTYDPPTLGVHAFANDGKWRIATQPLADSIDSIFPIPENASGSSPALSFARNLNRRLGIPVGIVPAAVGGTHLDQWSPEKNGECYLGMCQRLEYTGAFKGYLWWQGCSDCFGSAAVTYLDRFKAMKRQLDEKFGPHPMLTVQINKWTKGLKPGEVDEDGDRAWGYVREAQRRAAMEIDDVYVVPSLDLYLSDGIHNGAGSNVIIGERLANTALAEIYNKPGQVAPNVSRVRRLDDTHLFLEFENGLLVTAMDNIGYGMNVEDKDGLIDCLTAFRNNNGLLVETARPFELPAKFHYAWRMVPPIFAARDLYDMPLLACYGVEICE